MGTAPEIADEMAARPSITVEEHQDAFSAFLEYARRLPSGVRSMTFGEFLADIEDGLR